MSETMTRKGLRGRIAVCLLAVVSLVGWQEVALCESWETLYRKGLKAFEKQDWLQAAEYLQKAIEEAKRSGPGKPSLRFTEDPENNSWMRFLSHGLGAAYANQATVCVEKGCVDESDSLARLAIPSVREIVRRSCQSCSRLLTSRTWNGEPETRQV